MTPIINHEICDASAWTPGSVGGKEGFVRTLTREELKAIHVLLQRLEGVKTQDIVARDFAHPSLDDLIGWLRHEVAHGKGAAILRGVDIEATSREDCERIFWGLGGHLGYLAVQSARGDRIGYVRHEPDDPKARGYRSSGELTLHTDSREIIALMALQPPESGGESSLASGATVHNVIRRERPDLLAPLYRGYRYHSNEAGLTQADIPVFSNVDGHLSVMFFQAHIRRAARTLGVALPPDLDEAVRFFAEVAAREDVAVNFTLDPGEMMFCNDFVVLHARTEFQDSATRRRLLARLWINARDARPVAPALHERALFFDRHHDPRYVEGSPLFAGAGRILQEATP